MARPKSAWRKIVNTRFLRWWAAKQFVRFIPSAGRILAFFPTAIGIESSGAKIVQWKESLIDPQVFSADKEFLKRCLVHDSTAPGFSLETEFEATDRTVLFEDSWVDMATGSTLLPKQAKTVLVRGSVANWNATSLRFPRNFVPIHQRIFAPLPTTNYYHLIVENGLRLLDLLSVEPLGKEPLIVALSEPKGAVENAMYSAIENAYSTITVQRYNSDDVLIPAQTVQHFPSDPHWEWTRFSRDNADQLCTLFRRYYSARNTNGAKKIYLSRGSSKLRRVLNDQQLSHGLSQRGFETFIASDTNHPEQIERFRSADTIVAVHGAGLTNLIFARPGTKVVEVFPGNFVKSTYWWMAKQLSLDYQPVIGGLGNYDQHFEVPVQSVLQALEGR